MQPLIAIEEDNMNVRVMFGEAKDRDEPVGVQMIMSRYRFGRVYGDFGKAILAVKGKLFHNLESKGWRSAPEIFGDENYVGIKQIKDGRWDVYMREDLTPMARRPVSAQ